MSRIKGYLSVELTDAETRRLKERLDRGQQFTLEVGKLPNLDVGVAFDIHHRTIWDFDNESGVLTIRRK